jgi:SAM-dependent methyltransferase
MPKLICFGAVPARHLRKVCFANPERLGDLATLVQISSDADCEKVSREFSEILFDVRIGKFRKRTNAGRLRETERVLCERLEQMHSAPVMVLDIGASDGVTTLDLVTALRAMTARPVKAVLADKDLWLIAYRRGWLTEYRTRSGEPVMVRYGRIGLRLPDSEYAWDFVSNAAASYYLTCSRLRASLREERHISLVNPRVLMESAVTPVELNCLVLREEFRQRFDAIRASNVLHPHYFTPEQLVQTVRNCHTYLKPGGFLVVSRNHDEATGECERGSVWRKTPEGFHLEESFGDGSEIAALVSAVTIPPAVAAKETKKQGGEPSAASV